LLDIIILASDLAKTEEIEVYLVGGFVRDLLLGVDNFDLDIVVERDGIGFAKKLADRLNASLIKHRAFGTATITTKDNFKIDIATCRREVYPESAALPIVKEGNIEDDLFRRDYTINAMGCHIDFEKFGQIVDFYGGIKDLNQSCIRFLHEGSFTDDPTRIIRAVRFEQRLGFSLEPKTLSFIKKAKAKRMLEKVQKHRLRDEIILIFKENNPFKIIRRLDSIYNLTFVTKGISLHKDLNKIFSNLRKTGLWFQENFPQRRHPDVWLMYLIVFLSTLNRKSLNNFLKKYAFRKGETKRILSYDKEFKKIDKQLSKKSVTALKLHKLLDSLSYEVIIASYVVSRRQKTKQRIRDFFFEYHHKKITITGKDLLKLGVEPGPTFSDIFKAVFRAKINGRIHTHSEELEYAKKIMNKK